MSITNETIKKHLKDLAIFCCQRKKGLIISAADLEDPSLFEDMVESNLLTLSEEGLTIEEALGATLLEDCDALTPILPHMVKIQLQHDTKEKVKLVANEPSTRKNKISTSLEDKVKITKKSEGKSGMIHIEIDKLEGLVLDIPVGLGTSVTQMVGGEAQDKCDCDCECKDEIKKEKVIRTLKKSYFQVNDVILDDKTSFSNGVLSIDKSIMEQAIKADSLVKELKIDIIKPSERHIYTDTIMDVCPIATKTSGVLGEGTTNVMQGVVFMLTGVDEDGTQVHEFGASEGYLDEKMAFGNPGCADKEDIIIRVEAKIQRLTGMERRGPYAAHKCEDVVIQAVRDVLKKTTDKPVKEEICEDIKKYGKPRVVLVKEIMGQGAMHDNILCPKEPCGVLGGQKNVDLGNVPLMLSPNEVRDGGIHALTCIGPATKEMTRHYFREPLVEALANDDEFDLIGVIFVGSPQVNDEKSFVSERLGSWIESLDVEGAIVTTEGFGNNHIDFMSHIEQIGKRDIPVVGVSFCAYQGQLVVGNQYADAMIEINKDKNGFENEIAGCSEICPNDAVRAIALLKNKMMGVEIIPAERKWSQDVIDANSRLLGL